MSMTEGDKPRGRAFIRSRRLAWIASGVVVAALAFVLVWFQPQKLLLEETVDEALPTAGSEPVDSTGSSSAANTSRTGKPETLAEGQFQSLEHSTRGRASLLELPDGSHFLRFDDLDTSNGPDLRVYLSELSASDDWRAYGERFVDLGPLKGNRGDQNYELPRDLDLSRYRSAVIWCRRFTVGFGVAPLEPAAAPRN
jgi:hypothetical protein